jgi:hypothetical protein
VKSRPVTDLYLQTVAAAVANPGHWIEVPRRFATEMNAAVTGHCLQGGYLRVKPPDETSGITVDGRTFLRTAAPVDFKVEGSGTEWQLHLRARS